MMALFSVYLPKLQTGTNDGRLERARFVRDGFSWGGFLFPVLWLLWHRVWRWALAVMAFDVALLLLSHRLGVSSAALAAAGVMEMLFVGLEARHWFCLALERRGYELSDVVQAETKEDAEYRFFERAATQQPTEASVLPPQPAPRSYGVIGLFPEQGSY
jgi:hypothetical protein